MAQTTSLPEAPRFSTPAGEIIGWRDGGVIRATGIPYAHTRRFAPPEPLPPAARPIEATEWAPACPQRPPPAFEYLLGTSLDELEQHEACTALSICLPALEASKPRAVMVWIHGGSYTMGAGDLGAHDPRPLAEEQGVIVVNLTYRLGIFGFVGGSRERPANLGLLDIIAGLRWVKANIAAFGGDADNITLFGESAGGDAIAHLMVAEGTETLFQRAIIQSAPLGLTPGRPRMHAAMAKQGEAVDDSSSVRACLDAQLAAEKAGQRYLPGGLMPFGVQYGRPPLPALKARDSILQQREYDLLIGYNRDEAALFMNASPRLKRFFSLPLIGAPVKRALSERITAGLYARASERFARRHAASGGRSYLYRLHWCSGRTLRGACHTIDLPLLFAGWAQWRRAAIIQGIGEAELNDCGRRTRALWARFAREGALEARGSLEGVLQWERITGQKPSAPAA
ncbi:carboxylesterase family protein, partial [Kushneria aurantia]